VAPLIPSVDGGYKLPDETMLAIRTALAGSFQTKAQVVAAIAEALKNGDVDYGPVGSAMGKLDSKLAAKFVVAAAADSTADEGDEWFEGAWRAIFASSYPERAVALRRFNKATDQYAAQVTWQNGTGSPGTAVTGLEAGGPVKSTKTVFLFSDTFNRTADDVVGTRAETASAAWIGAAGQYTLPNAAVVGARLTSTAPPVSAASANTPVCAFVADGAHDALDGKWSTLFRLSTATNGRTYTTRFWGPLTESGDGIWLDMVYSDSTVTAQIVGNLGANIRTIATFPATVLETNKVDQFVKFDLSIAGRALTAQLGAAKVTGIITEPELAAWTPYDRVQFGSDDDRFRLDYVTLAAQQTTVTESTGAPVVVSPGVGLQAAVYNGAIAGSKIEDQLARFEKLYPVRPDLMMIGHGLNYEADSPTVFLAAIQAFVDKLQSVYPGTPVAIISQNPRYPAAGVPASRITDHEARQKAIAGYAAARQWLFIDTFSAFEKLPDGGLAYVTDDKHPNTAGRAVQVATVRAALTSIASTTPPGVVSGVRLEQVPNFPYRLRIQS
jgi:hypothetical protein